MFLLKDMSLKNLAMTAVGFLSALFTFLALSTFKLIVFPFGEGGFTAFKWIFDAKRLNSWNASGFGTFVAIVAFIFAIGTVGLFLATFVVASDKSTYRKGMRLVCLLSVATTLILMIAGFIVIGGLATNGSMPDCSTATYIPLIINVILTAGYFGADMVLGD